MITNKDLHLFYTCSFLGRGRGACSLRQEWSKGDWDKMVISPWTYKRITKSRYFSLWRSERKPKKCYTNFSSVQFSSVQFSSFAQSCPTLCDLMNCSMSGLPVHHQLPESTQTHAHWVLMPSNHLIFCRPLLLPPSTLPSIRVFSNESALCIRWPKYWSFSFSISLPMNTQDWSPLGWTAWISLQSKGLSRVFSNTTVQKHQFFGAQLSSQSNSHIHTWPLEKP